MQPDQVHLNFPARPEYIRLTRLVVSGLAAQVSCSMDEIEDLRIAVDELCSTLIEQSVDAAEISITFTILGSTLGFRATVPVHGGAIELDELAENVLRATVDSHRLVFEGQLAIASMEKTCATTAA